MRPTTVTVTASGTSAVVVLDYLPTPFNVGLAVVVSGSPTYTVQHSYDDPFAYGSNYSTSATWFPYSGATLSGATANGEGSYTTPRRACRLVTSGAANTAATLTVVQGGNAG